MDAALNTSTPRREDLRRLDPWAEAAGRVRDKCTRGELSPEDLEIFMRGEYGALMSYEDRTRIAMHRREGAMKN